ncbi:MAG: RnfABCDGE type electron transport complex subunit G [Firmicutes bacterium]|nr:RnfABCDGE type electron transport complex subunit G [Bacillota bacterium]
MGSILKPATVLFLVCLIVTCGLALTYNLTKDKIGERAALDAENARKEILSDADSFMKVENIEDIAEHRTELKLIKEAYVGLKAEKELGYVFLVVNKGYGGDISVMVGVDKSRKVTGVKIVKHSETPGLGSKATDKAFLSQLVDITPKEGLKVVKGQKGKPEEINAVSGATVTSKAVVGAVQAALDMSVELDKLEESGELKKSDI